MRQFLSDVCWLLVAAALVALYLLGSLSWGFEFARAMRASGSMIP